MTATVLDERQLDLLFKKSRDFVFLCKKSDDDYIYVYTNPAAYTVFNQLVIGKKLTELISRDYAKLILKYYNAALKTDEPQVFQDYSPVGEEVRKYESSVTPIIINTERYILTITKEIAFDRDFQDKYLFMRSIFFKTFLSTILISRDWKLLEANRSFLETFQLDIEQVRHKDFHQLNLLDKRTLKDLKDFVINASDGDQFYTRLLKLKSLAGGERSFTATFAPLVEDGEVAAIFIILQEVTKFLKQERELREMTHGLEILKRAMNKTADISLTDLQGNIVDINTRFIERSGFSREELIGSSHRIVNSRYHPAGFYRDLWQKISSGKVWRGEICNRNKFGVPYWSETTIIPLSNADGQVVQYLGIHFDVSEKKQAMSRLRNVERTFRMITENTNDFIIITDEAGIISYASPSYMRMLGYREEELLGKFYCKFLDKESIPKWRKILDNLHKSGKEEMVELKLKTKNGALFWTEGHYKVALEDNDYGMNQIIMLSREITQRKEQESRLMFLAYHDSLTNLPNRRYINREFPHLMEQARLHHESIAVVYIDGDDFKIVNDEYGHDIGDEFIRQFSQALLKAVTIEDIVSRIGGDEFIVLLTKLPQAAEKRIEFIQDFIKRVKLNLQEGWFINEHHFSPTASMGVSLFPEHGEELGTLLEKADQSLYKAKLIRKNSVKFYE